MENYANRNLIYTKPKYWIEFLSGAIFAFFLIVSIFIVGFNYIYISTPVIGLSMQPTLNAKGSDKSDVVYVNRFASIQKQDIIIIEQPDDSEHQYIIKRVIATEGDTVNIVENPFTLEIELYLNGEILQENYLYDYENGPDPNNLGMHTTLYNFNQLKNPFSEHFKPELFNENGELVVPSGQVFVLGDNRGNSIDSATKGTYSLDLVIGKVEHIVPYGKHPFVYFLNYFTPFDFEWLEPILFRF